MAVPSYHEFLDRFRLVTEFREIDQAAIEAEITGASLRVNPNSWGEQQAEGILYLAAHRVVDGHRVKCCKLINKDNSTSFLAEYERMRESIISGDRVF